MLLPILLDRTNPYAMTPSKNGPSEWLPAEVLCRTVVKWTLLIGILVIVSQFAWSLRPLNDVERMMIGVWRYGLTGVTFTPDRRYEIQYLQFSDHPGDVPHFVGTWACNDSQVTFRMKSEPFKLESRYQVFVGSSAIEPRVSFEGADRMRIDALELQRSETSERDPQ